MGTHDEVAHIEQSGRADADNDPADDYALEDAEKQAQRLHDPAWLDAQKRYLRKLDLIILPTISLLYFFEYLDRGNVAV